LGTFGEITLDKISHRTVPLKFNDSQWAADCSAQNRPRELKLVSLEPPGHEDSEHDTKSFYSIWKLNGNAPLWSHNFCSLGRVGRCGTHFPTEAVVIATLWELDENDRFFTTSCDLNMSHILRLFNIIYLKKDTKDCF
jgi:hypothetical protein